MSIPTPKHYSVRPGLKLSDLKTASKAAAHRHGEEPQVLLLLHYNSNYIQ
jgi:hypothetical protein